MLVVPEIYLKLKTNMNVFLNAQQLVLFLFNSNLTSCRIFMQFPVTAEEQTNKF